MWCKMVDNCQSYCWFRFAAQAEDFDIGKSEFQSSCASCHGTDAKGKGPVSGQLKIPPPDLTMLAKSNNGVFPTDAVYETIYGLKTIPAHGTREMPIWGERFNPIIKLPHYVDPSYWKMAGPEQNPGSRRANTHPRCYRLSKSCSAKVDNRQPSLACPANSL